MVPVWGILYCWNWEYLSMVLHALKVTVDAFQNPLSGQPQDWHPSNMPGTTNTNDKFSWNGYTIEQVENCFKGEDLVPPEISGRSKFDKWNF